MTDRYNEWMGRVEAIFASNLVQRVHVEFPFPSHSNRSLSIIYLRKDFPARHR
jgi:hypothetical protein